MRPTLTGDEPVTLRRKLLYARWLYEKGVHEAELHDELSHMMAIMHFHNAIEIVLSNLLVYYRWATSAQLRQFRFEHMIEEVGRGAAAADPPLAVPSRTDIIRLSETRNNVMHHGQRFHRTEAEWARGVCRRFLVDAVRDFLEEDIEAMAMADLLENSYVRRLLERAAECLDTGEYDETAALCALVVRMAERALSHGFQRGQDSFWNSVHFKLFTMHVNERGVEEILRMYSDRMGEIENRLLLLGLGIDLADAYRFFGWEINVYDPATIGDIQRYVQIGRPRQLELLRPDAEFAVHFATDVALRVQSLGLGEFMTRQVLFHDRHGLGDWQQIQVAVPDEIIEEAPQQVEPPEGPDAVLPPPPPEAG